MMQSKERTSQAPLDKYLNYKYLNAFLWVWLAVGLSFTNCFHLFLIRKLMVNAELLWKTWPTCWPIFVVLRELQGEPFSFLWWKANWEIHIGLCRFKQHWTPITEPLHFLCVSRIWAGVMSYCKEEGEIFYYRPLACGFRENVKTWSDLFTWSGAAYTLRTALGGIYKDCVNSTVDNAIWHTQHGGFA